MLVLIYVLSVFTVRFQNGILTSVYHNTPVVFDENGNMTLEDASGKGVFTVKRIPVADNKYYLKSYNGNKISIANGGHDAGYFDLYDPNDDKSKKVVNFKHIADDKYTLTIDGLCIQTNEKKKIFVDECPAKESNNVIFRWNSSEENPQDEIKNLMHMSSYREFKSYPRLFIY